tara:strand:- start:184 stop:360 length:177 start_codon:yes stop_codon:yes gene_type:complete
MPHKICRKTAAFIASYMGVLISTPHYAANQKKTMPQEIVSTPHNCRTFQGIIGYFLYS